MIRQHPSGKYYCDGRECGYPLAWFKGDLEEDGAEGEWVCLDCNDSISDSASPLPPNNTKSEVIA